MDYRTKGGFCFMGKRIVEEQYNEVAQERGFVFIGPYTGRTHDAVTWQCDQGHKWNTRYSHILRGHSCPFCVAERTATKKRIKKDDYHKLAQQNGFAFIGPYTASTLDSVAWKCTRGHTWNAKYGNIQQGRGCPLCANHINGIKSSKQQNEIGEMFNGLVNYEIGGLFVDVALPDIELVIEYDSWYWHGKREKEDRERIFKVLLSGWRVVVIKSNRQVPTKEEIQEVIGNGAAYAEIIMEDWGVGPTKK